MYDVERYKRWSCTCKAGRVAGQDQRRNDEGSLVRWAQSLTLSGRGQSQCPASRPQRQSSLRVWGGGHLGIKHRPRWAAPQLSSISVKLEYKLTPPVIPNIIFFTGNYPPRDGLCILARSLVHTRFFFQGPNMAGALRASSPSRVSPVRSGKALVGTVPSEALDTTPSSSARGLFFLGIPLQ